MAHLSGFGLENFRVFKDYTWFDFAPITILIGPNSSGKSSLIKALLLLKDNYEKGILPATPFTNELKFDGALHQLSSAINTVNYTDELFGFTLPRIYKPKSNITLFGPHLGIDFSPPTNLYETIKLKANDESNSVDTFIDLRTGDRRKVFSLSKKEMYFDVSLALELISPIKSSRSGLLDLEGEDDVLSIEERTILELIDQTEKYFEQNSSFIKNVEFEKVFSDFKGTPIIVLEGDPEKRKDITYNEFYSMALKNLTKFFVRFSLLSTDASDYLKESTEAMTMQKVNLLFTLLGINAFGILDAMSRYMNFSFFKHYKSFTNMRYIPSVKGTSKRSYQSFEDNTLNDIMKNVKKANIADIQQFVDTWGNTFGINDIKVGRNDQLDVNYLTVNDRSITDLGFGLSQLSSIILTLALRKGSEDIFLFEEPEANLHPKFQSKLADLFSDTYKESGNQFIIETHSEYMIRKFQILVKEEKIKPEDIVIYYFNDPNGKKEDKDELQQVKKINVLEDGSLSDDFGSGFYDEAANLAISLFDLRKNRQN